MTKLSSGATELLAEAIYARYGRRDLNDVRPWKDLIPRRKRFWVEKAERILKYIDDKKEL